jgi:Ser/Thr protein kinase RdoA (MazF antagonist)
MDVEEVYKVVEKFEAIGSDFEWKLIESGHINLTYCIQNNSHKYILQKVNTSIFPHLEVISSNMLEVSKHLKSKEYPHEIIELLPFSTGEFIWENQWRILPFLDNTQSFEKVESTQQCFEAAKFLGEFHLTIKDLDSSRIQNPLPNFLNYEDRWQDFMMSVDFAQTDRYSQGLPEIEFVYENRGLLDHWIQLQTELPKRIIHADPKISNFLFDAQNSLKVKALIDWDTLMPGSILYDFGDMVRSYTNLKAEDDPKIGKNFSKENYESLKNGFLFHLENELLPIEKENLSLAGKSIIYIQAIRFLTDFLKNDTYYHTSYADQNLNRTKNQLNLLKELMNYLQD